MNVTKYDYSRKEENGNVYEATFYRLDADYLLAVYKKTYASGKITERCEIGFDDYNRATENYLPMIYSKSHFGVEKIIGFGIATTSHGTLNPDEIKKVIDGYNRAIEIVQVLNCFFGLDGKG